MSTIVVHVQSVRRCDRAILKTTKNNRVNMEIDRHAFSVSFAVDYAGHTNSHIILLCGHWAISWYLHISIITPEFPKISILVTILYAAMQTGCAVSLPYMWKASDAGGKTGHKQAMGSHFNCGYAFQLLR